MEPHHVPRRLDAPRWRDLPFYPPPRDLSARDARPLVRPWLIVALACVCLVAWGLVA